MRRSLAFVVAALLPAAVFAQVALAQAALAQEALAQETQPKLPVLDILSIYRDLNDMCRTRTGDGMHMMQACHTREKVSRILNSWGYCYGAKGQDEADMQWHKCAEKELF